MKSASTIARNLLLPQGFNGICNPLFGISFPLLRESNNFCPPLLGMTSLPPKRGIDNFFHPLLGGNFLPP
jgi:hypothetical protein